MQRRLFLSTLAAAARRTSLAAPSAYTFQSEGVGKTLKAADGRTVLSYLTAKPPDVPLAGNNVCCFHPLNTPSGERITDIAPPDHRDHRGVFFAWQNLEFHRPNAVVAGDFWGWGRFAPTEGRLIQNRELRLVNSSATAAELAIRNEWTVNGENMMNESLTAITTESHDARVLDLIWTFTSDGDVVVRKAAFTGLCVRCRKDGVYWLSDKNGKVDLPDSNATRPELNWPSADWYAHTIALASGKTITAALVDHPSNPRSTWHEPRSVSFLNPCVSALGDLKIPAGRPLVLRYRLIAKDGEVNIPDMNALAAEWRATR